MTQEALLNSHLGYDILYELIVSGMFKFLCTKQVGTLLYLRVVKTNIGMNPELSCTEGKLKALEAKTVLLLLIPFKLIVSCFYVLASGKAALFGPLRDGFMFETSTGLSRM